MLGKGIKSSIGRGRLLLLLLMFAEKKSVGRSLELENMWIGKLSHYEEIL